MGKYVKTLHNVIVGGVRYSVGEKYLLCTATIARDGVFFDPKAKIKRLYYPRGKAFLIVTDGQMIAGRKVELVTEKQARQFMDAHPEGINEKVYIKYFGKPAEL